MPYLNRDDKRAELTRAVERIDPAHKGRDSRHLIDLDREFPGVDLFGPQCISAHCGQGWASLVRTAVSVIAALGGKVTQIKQKFGQLRIYWDPPDALRHARLAWIDQGKIGPDPFEDPMCRAAWEAVHYAEEASLGTCEHCGITIVPPRGPSFQTLCDRCSK